VLARITASASPIPRATRLAFLADRTIRVLRAPNDISSQDLTVLSQAIELLSSALQGSDLIAEGSYSVSAGQMFTDLGWTVSALGTMSAASKLAQSSDSREFLSRVSDALTRISDHREVDQEWVDACSLFFRSLRNVVLSTWSRPTDRFSVRD
jgi:hypothetical protein